MGDTDNFDFASMNEKNQQTLSDIQNLQQIETEIYTSLEQGIAAGTLSEDQKQLLMNQINEITQTRINLYKILNNVYTFVDKNVSNSNASLNEQTQAITIVERELNRAKAKLKELNQDKYNKIRMVEINTYYGKQYAAHIKFFKMTAFVFVLLLLLVKFRQMLPGFLLTGLIACIIFIYAIMAFYYIVDLMDRSNYNYDQYNFPRPNGSPADGASGSTSSNNPWTMPTIECVGSACCSAGSTYNSALNMCELGASTTSSSTLST
jgi:hypothetical protein